MLKFAEASCFFRISLKPKWCAAALLWIDEKKGLCVASTHMYWWTSWCGPKRQSFTAAVRTSVKARTHLQQESRRLHKLPGADSLPVVLLHQRPASLSWSSTRQAVSDSKLLSTSVQFGDRCCSRNRALMSSSRGVISSFSYSKEQSVSHPGQEDQPLDEKPAESAASGGGSDVKVFISRQF